MTSKVLTIIENDGKAAKDKDPNLTDEQLLDHARLRAQQAGLERRTARGGRDSIDHPPGSHDDLINAAAGALVSATSGGVVLTQEWVDSFCESLRAGRRKSPWSVGERWPY